MTTYILQVDRNNKNEAPLVMLEAKKDNPDLTILNDAISTSIYNENLKFTELRFFFTTITV